MAEFLFRCRVEYDGAQIMVEADSLAEARVKAEAGDGDIITDGAGLANIRITGQHPTRMGD